MERNVNCSIGNETNMQWFQNIKIDCKNLCIYVCVFYY